MARFITLAGRKQVGKDTCALYINNMVDSTTTKVRIAHFADSLKDACTMIFGIDRGDMETETGKKKLTDIRWPLNLHLYDMGDKCHDTWRPQTDSRFMTVREVLQFVGTELFRTQIDPDVWARSVFRRQYGENDIVVVADCRFPNEANQGREHGLLINVKRTTGLEGDSHASETALDGYEGYHATIENNGSFENLRSQLEALLREHKFL